MWGILYGIILVPQNIVVDVNNDTVSSTPIFDKHGTNSKPLFYGQTNLLSQYSSSSSSPPPPPPPPPFYIFFKICIFPPYEESLKARR